MAPILTTPPGFIRTPRLHRTYLSDYPSTPPAPSPLPPIGPEQWEGFAAPQPALSLPPRPVLPPPPPGYVPPGETFRDLGGALGYGLGKAGETLGRPLGEAGETIGKYLAAPTRWTYALTPEQTAEAYATGELPPGAIWTDSGPAYPTPRLQPRGEELGLLARMPLVEAATAIVPSPVRGPGVFLGSRGIIKRQVGEVTGKAPEQLALTGERVPTFRPEGVRPEVQAELPGGIPGVTMREGAAAQAQRQAAIARGQAELPLETAIVEKEMQQVVAASPPKVTEALAEPNTSGLPRERQTAKVSDLEYKPDLFQTRDADPGSAISQKRVDQLVEGWDLAQFSPPSVVADPEKPGKFIVYRGHHRAAAYEQIYGKDAPIEVSVTRADIRSPEQLLALQLEGDASNFKTALPNFREKVRAVERAASLGQTDEQIATRLRMGRGEVQDLKDAGQLGVSTLERIVTEPGLGPYAAELGRGMRLYGVSLEDAGGWFKRLADAPKGQRPTISALRQTVDKFGRELTAYKPVSLPGFEAVGAERGGILAMMDDAAKARSALELQATRLRSLQKHAAVLAGAPTVTGKEREAIQIGIKAAERHRKALLDQIKAADEDVLAAFQGVAPKRAISSAEAGKPVRTEATSILPRSQPLGPNISAQTILPSRTLRARTEPSTRTGPSRTVESVVGDIEPTSNRIILQPESDVKTLRRMARQVLPALGSELQAIVGEVKGASFAGARVKGEAGIARKLGYNFPPQTISDFLGGRVAIETEAAADEIASRLAGRIVKDDNFLNTPSLTGYRARHISVRLSNGMTAEIQLVPKEMAAVQERAHKYLEVLRRPDVSAAERDRAVASSRAIMDKAWARYSARTGQPVVAPTTRVPEVPRGLSQADVEAWVAAKRAEGAGGVQPPKQPPSPEAAVPPEQVPPSPPVKAMESPAPPPAGQPSQRFLMRFRPTESIIAEATQPTALRRVTEALGQTPFRRAIEVVDPAAVVREPSEKMLLAYQIDLDAASQAVNSMGVRLSRLKNPFTIAGGRATNVQGSPAWGDIFQAPKRYSLNAEQRKFVEVYRALVDDATAMLKEHGVSFRELGFGSEEGYFPRLVNAIREVERSRGAVRGAIGAKQTFQKGRIYSEMAEGIEQGVKYEDDPLKVLDLHLRGVYKTIADKRLTDAIKPLGKVPKAPLALREEAAKLGLQLRNAKRLLEATKRASRGESLPIGTLNAIKRDYPEQVSRLVAKGKELPEVKKFAQTEIARLQPLRRMAVGERTKALERARQPSFSESYIMQPGVAGRIFPIEVANAVSKAVGQAAPDWLKAVSSVNVLSRTLGTTLDIGAPFLQGLPIIASHPIVWGKATLNHLVTIVKPEVYANYLERNADIVNEMASFNVPLGMGGAELVEMAGRIPGFRRFGKAFTAFGDIARLELWKALRESAEASGELHQLAAFTRNATGVTSTRALGVGTSQRLMEANLLFAPRFTRAAFALMLDAAQGGIRGSQARRSLVSLLTASAAMTVGGGMALGLSKGEIQKRLNPRGGLFMTLPIFGQNIGPGGNVISVIRLLGEITEAAADDPTRFADLDPRSQRNPVTRWLWGKAAPLPSAALDLTFGQDFLGQPTDILQVVGRRALPFWASQVVPGLARAREATASGIGAQFLGLRGWPESLTRMLRDNLAQERFKKQWQDLNFRQQAEIRRASPNLVETERQSKAERTPIDLNRMAEEQKRTGEWVEGQLPSNLRSELKDLGMTFGGLSRGIGPDPGWYMNDAFYDRYKTLATQRLAENMGKTVSTSRWKAADAATKRALLSKVITLSKGQARTLVMRESLQGEGAKPAIAAPTAAPRVAPTPTAVPKMNVLPPPPPGFQQLRQGTR